MKRIFSLLFFVILIISSVGCGNNTASSTTNTAAEKVDEVKKEVAANVADAANEVGQKATEIANDSNAPPTPVQEITLGGIAPGMTFAEIQAVLGEPVSRHDDEEFTFSNGLVVEMDDHRDVVKEIKARQNGISAAKGVAIGMTEQNLLDAYGNADRVEHDGGGTEYKYFSPDRTKKIVFKVFNGVITEIKCELDD